MAATYEAEILRNLGVDNKDIIIGDPLASPPTGNLPLSDVEGFENDAKRWAANFIGKDSLTSGEISSLQNPIVWFTVSLILKKLLKNADTIWMAWRNEAIDAINFYIKSQPEIEGDNPMSSRPRGDEESTREDPFPRSATDLFIRNFG